MKSTLGMWLLICAAISLLAVTGRLDLLAVVAPVSIAMALLAARVSSSSSGRVQYRSK